MGLGRHVPGGQDNFPRLPYNGDHLVQHGSHPPSVTLCSKQRPLKILPEEAAAHVGSIGQQEHCHLVLHAAVADQVSIIPVDGLYRVLDRLHIDPLRF